MRTFGIRTPLIEVEDDLLQIFLDSAHKNDIKIKEKCVIIVTSKIVAISQGRKVSYQHEAEFLEIIRNESDEILGSSSNYGLLLTRKNGFVMPNSGIDKSNAREGEAILMPADPQGFVNSFRHELSIRMGISNLGIILADSRVVPFRLGISGVALAWSGFFGIEDKRGKKDLFDRELKVSQIAVADNLATVAQLYFGQADERVPFVVCADAPVIFTDLPQDFHSAQINLRDDLYTDFFGLK